MKKKFLKKSLFIIKKYYPNYDNKKLEKIKYGLEGMYLTITKIIIIFFISFFLGIFKEMILLLLFYNILRFLAFGLHATKSIYCSLSSLIFFVGTPLLLKHIEISLNFKLIISALCLLAMYKYAPADTEKRPLINRKKCIFYKYASIFIGSVYFFFIINFNNNTISNILLFALIIETLLILPISYKIFNLKYNNYKSYLENF